MVGDETSVMQIGVDMRPLRLPLTGIGNYQFHLMDALLDKYSGTRFQGFGSSGWMPIDRALLARVVTKTDAEKSERSASGQFALRGRGLTNNVAVRHGYEIWKQVAFAWTARGKALKAFHAFAYVPPGDINVPVIPVVYDMSFVRFPEMHPSGRVRSLRGLGKIVKDAPIVHTISQFSANEICSLIGVEPSRVAVIYPGINPLYTQSISTGAKSEIARLELMPNNYFLAVSTLEPRKNLRTLIAAYSRLSETLRDRIPLCIAGAKGWGNLDLPASSEALERRGHLRFLGFVSDEQLKVLYSHARAFFYPSLYEGFGMPIIEALACGTRVVCSDAASMPEAAGTVSQKVAPLDVDAWYKAINQAIDESDTDREKQERQLHARQFDWHRAAEQTMALYRKI